MRYGLDFQIVMLNSEGITPRQRQMSALCIAFERGRIPENFTRVKRDGGAHIQQGSAASLCVPLQDAREAICSLTRQLGRGAGRTIEGKALPAVARLLGEG